MESSTQLATRNHQAGSLSINKRDGFDFDYGYDRIEQTLKLCDSISQSGMVPREYQNAPKKVLVAAAMGARFGLDPLQSLQSIAVVNGSPTFYGDSLMGIVKGSGKEEFTLEGVKAMEYAAEYSEIYKGWLEHYEYKPSRIAFCVTKRKDEDEPHIQHYTVDQAREAGLLGKENWKKYLMRMLQMRARSYALRDAFPDVLRGYKTYEEMQDVDDAERYKMEPLPESTGEFIEAEEWNEAPKDAPAEQDEPAEILAEDLESPAAEPKEPEPEEESPLLESADMTYEDAIEEIEGFDDPEALARFFSNDDGRVTVQRAFDRRMKELRGETSESKEEKQKPQAAPSPPSEPPPPEQGLFDNEPQPEEKQSEASFGDFDDDFFSDIEDGDEVNPI